MKTQDIQFLLDGVDAIATWLLDAAQSAEKRGDFNSALELVRSAAVVLSRQNRSLISPRAERLVHTVATSGNMSRVAASKCLSDNTESGSLHVLSELLPAGGISALVERWMELDSVGVPHHVVLLRQTVPVPENFTHAVLRRGGRLFIAPSGLTTIETARWLRALAVKVATNVVLHVDVSDVTSAAAFAADGGPPVMLVNHSAHVFWLGASFADTVLNLRGSVLEAEWTRRYRGVSHCATLPIPIDQNNEQKRGIDRPRVREELEIPQDAVVILTIGASFKYLPFGGLDFLKTLVDVLRSVPNAVLLAVGVANDERWSEASRSVSGRVRALGVLSRDQVERVQAISNLYVEGFPFGTTTALLEACQRGVPAILAPSECPPPYATDGVAFDGLTERPASLRAFSEQIVRLCRNSSERKLLGAAQSRAVSNHHCGSGWAAYLDRARISLPREHNIRLVESFEVTPPAVHEYWSRFVIEQGGGYQWLVQSAIADNLRSGRLLRLPERFVRILPPSYLGVSGAVSARYFGLAVNSVLPRLPARIRPSAFRVIYLLARGSLVQGVFRRLSSRLYRKRPKSSWYDEYRRVQR